jgi:hypothetical protein
MRERERERERERGREKERERERDVTLHYHQKKLMDLHPSQVEMLAIMRVSPWMISA